MSTLHGKLHPSSLLSSLASSPHASCCRSLDMVVDVCFVGCRDLLILLPFCLVQVASSKASPDDSGATSSLRMSLTLVS